MSEEQRCPFCGEEITENIVVDITSFACGTDHYEGEQPNFERGPLCYEAQLATLTHENNELGASLAVEKIKTQNQAAILRKCLEVVEIAAEGKVISRGWELIDKAAALLPELKRWGKEVI
ncbi:MAG: hypothetical protein WC356_04860 [Candidatus Micrarchaeia archaeon]|jgi:hypothetical protein